MIIMIRVHKYQYKKKLSSSPKYTKLLLEIFSLKENQQIIFLIKKFKNSHLTSKIVLKVRIIY